MVSRAWTPEDVQGIAGLGPRVRDEDLWAKGYSWIRVQASGKSGLIFCGSIPWIAIFAGMGR